MIKNKKRVWSSYFEGNSPSPVSFNDKTRHVLNDANIYILNSHFSNINPTEIGGCAYVSNDQTSILVEESSFSTLTSSYHASALFLKVKNIIYNKINAIKCKSTYGSDNGAFDKTEVAGDWSSLNQIHLSSFTYITNEKRYYPLMHFNGKVITNMMNSSMNNCNGGSSFYCAPSSKSNEVSSLLSYSYFANNTNNELAHSLYFIHSSSQHDNRIQCCNIIHNTITSAATSGLINSQSKLTINDSCILYNKAPYILAVTTPYSIYLIRTNIDNLSSTPNTVINRDESDSPVCIIPKIEFMKKSIMKPASLLRDFVFKIFVNIFLVLFLTL